MSVDRLRALREEITAHNHVYYSGNPTISDAAFDALYSELVGLEAQHPEEFSFLSPTQRIGGPPTGCEGVKVSHEIPMLSLENCFSQEDLIAFHHRVGQLIHEPRYAVEYKVDGMSLALRYERGELISALSRGDGHTGEYLLPAAVTIRGLPVLLPPNGPQRTDIFEIRGEVYIGHSDFVEFQKKCLARGEDRPVHPRSTAVGAMRQQDTRITYDRPLRFVAHGYGRIDGYGIMRQHSAIMDLCNSCGISTVPKRRGNMSFGEALEYVEQLAEAAPQLDMPVDGIVLKVELESQRDMLGAGTKYPRWAVAYKWQKLEAETTVNAVTIQVGKHGTLTPVAELEPVEIDGSIISRASLFNQDEIDRVGVAVGSRVIVEKAGAIIPHITRIVPDGTTRTTYTLPSTCPACGSDSVREGAAIFCSNPSCPAQLHATLCAAVGRPHLDIRGLGPTTITALIDAGLLADLLDLYRLERRHSEVVRIDGISDSKFRKLCDNVAQSKDLPSWRQLAAWGIRHCGITVAEKLMRHLGGINQLRQLLLDDPESVKSRVPGIGDKMLSVLVTYFSMPEVEDRLRELELIGVNLGARDPETVSGGILDGLKIVPTGELRRWTREGIKAEIRRHGGLPVGSVSAKTDLILAGTEPGPKKLEKARNLGIRVINEGEFVEMINPVDNASA